MPMFIGGYTVNHFYPKFIPDTDNSAPIYAIIPKKSKSPFIGLWEVGTFNRVQKHANRVDRPITILNHHGSVLFTLQPENRGKHG